MISALARASSTSKNQELLDMARQGDTDAIATILNSYLQYKKVNHTRVQVRRKESSLFILCESKTEPCQQQIADAFEKILQRLDIRITTQVFIYGRIFGQSKPLWNITFQIRPRLPLSDLEQWSNQGDQFSSQFSIIGSIRKSRENIGEKLKNRFLRFSLTPNSAKYIPSFDSMILSGTGTALLPLEKIQEVLEINLVSILPVPYMQACVLGIYNYRGNMLWIVDLTQQLCDRSFLTDKSNRQTISILVLRRDDGALLGIAVPKILDIESYTEEQIEIPTASLFPDSISPFVDYYLPQSLSPILNVQALTQDPKLQQTDHVYSDVR